MGGQKKSPAAKRKGNKKKEDLKKKQAEKQEEENEAEFQKAVLEIRVKELETLNTGLTGKCDYLESQNSVYKTQLEETKEEKTDLVTYLQKSLNEEQTIVKELEDRLYGMQEARKEDIRDFDRISTQKDQEFETMKTKLDKTILELGLKLGSIEEFRKQKVELEKQMADLEKTLSDERKMFNEKYNELENKTIAYREKLKRDAIDTLTKMAEDVQKAGKKSFSSTVKVAIAANVRLNQELEIVSTDNLRLRESLETAASKIRELKSTVEIIEEENSFVHKKCLQYKELVEVLLDKQVQMDGRIKLVEHLELELHEMKDAHASCKTEEELSELVKKEVAKVQNRSMPSYEIGSLLGEEVKKLKEVIVKMAIVSKDLSEAENEAEYKFLTERFKTMLVKLYETACDIQDLPDETKSRLVVQLPQVSTLKSFS